MNTSQSIKLIRRLLAITICALFVDSASSGQVTYSDDSYASGDTLTAADLNAKFNEIKADVNDNDSRVSTMAQGSISGSLNKQLTGIVGMSGGTTVVVGNGTLFTSELNVGDAVLIAGESFVVNTISSDTSLATATTRVGVGVADVNIFSDSDLLSIKSGVGADKAVITKSGDLIRRVVRATGLGPNDGRDTGLITGRQLVVKKSKAETALRIIYGDNFRVLGPAQACRWEIVVDGVSCPGGALVYDMYSSSVNNRHLPVTVFGFCEGLSAGAHTIEINVGPTPGYTTPDCYTGWQASRWTLEAEEVY